MAGQQGTKTLIDQGVIARAVAGVKYILSGVAPDGWFGPGQPMQPEAQQQAQGRQFDFATMHNAVRSTKGGPTDVGGVTFAQLRSLADGYDLLRLMIETRKDQMSKLRWSFGLKKRAAEQQKMKARVAKVKADAQRVKEHNAQLAAGTMPLPGSKPEPTVPDMPEEDPRIEELETFFAYPDQEHDWDTWLRMILEDLLVIDAPALYVRNTNGGDLYALEPLDGSTITRLLDDHGRTPLPPDPAYQQILKGMPAVDYSRDELVYKPRNLRTHRVYGYSPVEQIIMTVNIALRRQVWQLQKYTEGNIPEALIGVPEVWSPDQIAQFQEYWDAMLEGDTAQRRHAKFVPGGITPTFTKEEDAKQAFDEWLARIVAFAFSVSPQALVAQMNRATAQTAHGQALAEGLQPVMNWVKNLIDYIIVKYFGYDDMEFKWEEEEEADPLTQTQILTGYVEAGIMTDDEARDKLGMDPLTEEQRDQLKPPAPPPPPMGADGKPVAPATPDDGKPAAPASPATPAAPGGGGSVGKSVKASRRLKPLSRNRKAVKAAVSSVKDATSAALASMGKRVAKQLASAMGKGVQTDPKIQRLIDELTFEELQDIAPDLAEILQDMAADGGQEALAQVISDFSSDQLDQVSEAAVRYAADRSATLIKGIEDSTRDMIRATVAQGEEEGWSSDQLSDALQDSYAFSDDRADTIARTETAYADIQGNMSGYAASGVVESKEWIIAQDQFCDDCNELHGVVVPLDSDFPDGIDGPPLHPNCRCDILPVLKEDDQ